MSIAMINVANMVKAAFTEAYRDGYEQCSNDIGDGEWYETDAERIDDAWRDSTAKAVLDEFIRGSENG